ncbi:secreted RxLR effector protein 161-like [Phragmites australis]|uniref:secreted RxLR effector protein 161-like n=1 Tax=Phragmites australis TaxID=29695 RepID=UPI002D7990B7|nr:secreted RxLR effector protein 161-like [Phragmites australis]
MENKLKLSKDEGGTAVDTTEYRSIVGSLRKLVNTRADIAFAVGLVSRFMESPTMQHMVAVRHLLRYVSGTLSFGCCYKYTGRTEIELIGYSDSDFAGDAVDRRSTSGMVFFLSESLITWASQKQKVVALSSCEAEYIAVATTACQGIWLSRLIGELTGADPRKFQLFVDNKSALELCKNPVHHGRSKHIDTRFHFIRECVSEERMNIDHVRTEEQVANILTKSL